MRKIIIAIDGFSACGKSITAQKIAHILGYTYVDSGAMYRALTLYFQQKKIPFSQIETMSDELNDIHITFSSDSEGTMEICLNGKNVEPLIRNETIANLAAKLGTVKKIRTKLTTLQQSFGEKKGIVMDGRDIGTAVFPQAELKLFMTADLQVRALRRYNELMRKSLDPDLQDITEKLKIRDKQDVERKVSPLTKASDAVVLDTTHMTIEEQVDKVFRLVTGKIIVG